MFVFCMLLGMIDQQVDPELTLLSSFTPSPRNISTIHLNKPTKGSYIALLTNPLTIVKKIVSIAGIPMNYVLSFIQKQSNNSNSNKNDTLIEENETINSEFANINDSLTNYRQITLKHWNTNIQNYIEPFYLTIHTSNLNKTSLLLIDHQAVLWCHQLIATITSAMTQIIQNPTVNSNDNTNENTNDTNEDISLITAFEVNLIDNSDYRGVIKPIYNYLKRLEIEKLWKLTNNNEYSIIQTQLNTNQFVVFAIEYVTRYVVLLIPCYFIILFLLILNIIIKKLAGFSNLNNKTLINKNSNNNNVFTYIFEIIQPNYQLNIEMYYNSFKYWFIGQTNGQTSGQTQTNTNYTNNWLIFAAIFGVILFNCYNYIHLKICIYWFLSYFISIIILFIIIIIILLIRTIIVFIYQLIYSFIKLTIYTQNIRKNFRKLYKYYTKDLSNSLLYWIRVAFPTIIFISLFNFIILITNKRNIFINNCLLIIIKIITFGYIKSFHFFMHEKVSILIPNNLYFLCIFIFILYIIFIIELLILLIISSFQTQTQTQTQSKLETNNNSNNNENNLNLLKKSNYNDLFSNYYICISNVCF